MGSRKCSLGDRSEGWKKEKDNKRGKGRWSNLGKTQTQDRDKRRTETIICEQQPLIDHLSDNAAKKPCTAERCWCQYYGGHTLSWCLPWPWPGCSSPYPDYGDHAQVWAPNPSSGGPGPAPGAWHLRDPSWPFSMVPFMTPLRESDCITTVEFFSSSRFSSGILESSSSNQTKLRHCPSAGKLELILWQCPQSFPEDGSRGWKSPWKLLRKSLWSGINMQTGEQEWRVEPADSWADREAHEHPTVVLTKPWSHHHCMLFGSYEVNTAVWEARVQTLPLPSPTLWTQCPAYQTGLKRPPTGMWIPWGQECEPLAQGLAASCPGNSCPLLLPWRK